MSGCPVEGAALKNGAVAIDNNMSGRAPRFGTVPKVDRALCAHSGSEMNDEQAAHWHVVAAIDDGKHCVFEKVIRGDVHGRGYGGVEI